MIKKARVYDSTNLQRFLAGFVRRNPGEPEFHQAVREVAESVIPVIRKNQSLAESLILERMTEPDRVIVFRVTWEDDDGHTRVNRGYRVQFNNAIGPYKGGLRFHPSVNLSILKFLAFEQTFKNALTTLPLGAAKGGADFNPRGKSDREIRRFCKSFMLELVPYIGPDVDVPAGDIGVGGREIGYLFGQYKRITGRFASGTITGKGLEFGGSLIRKEATGFGAVYFTEEMLNHHGQSLEGKKCVVSGSGNVAQHCVEKIIDLGGIALTMSDSDGFVLDRDGISRKKLQFIMDLKNTRRGRMSEYAKKYPKAEFHSGKRPWGVACDAAFPCATQNEITLEDAKRLVSHGCIAVAEGANMPSEEEAMKFFRSKLLFAPAKAANAGGVAVSGLEMSQNALRLSWTQDEMDERLRNIMRDIHHQCVTHGVSGRSRRMDYVTGANIAAFLKVSQAMNAHGV